MSKLTPRLTHTRRALLVFGIITLAITANTLQTASTAAAVNFVVTNSNNNGPGSLRDAIDNANATAGADTITFNIPGPGVKVINLSEPLPEITEQVVIDASTQPGYAGTPLVELDGALVGNNSGLFIKAGGSTVRGLAIVRFNGNGITLSDCNNNLIQGNHIGVDAAGTVKQANGSGIHLSNSSNNLIGGTTLATRNVISGNVSFGVLVNGNGNIIQGNFIGTDVTGKVALGGQSGVLISDSFFITSTANLVGGNAAGAGNLISGNFNGVMIGSPGNTIQGNLIGTDITGTSAVPNTVGIDAKFVENTLIGGLVPGARNVISGNFREGVIFGGEGSKLQGNFVGPDITGTLPLGNGDTGVFAVRNPLIGGTVPEARNVIAANRGFIGNINLDGSIDSGSTVQGNYIGTDVTGTRALSPFSVGIRVSGTNNLIGGLVPGAQNVISGNGLGIMMIRSFSGAPQGTVILGNLIGLNSLGTGPLPNNEEGILFANTSGNTVGGSQVEAANRIAFNGGPGLRLISGSSGNSIRGNSIFSNGGLGIDLDPTGVTANDAKDSDFGPNGLQNFPVLTSVTSTANSTTIQGSLNSTPNSAFQIDFYSSAALGGVCGNQGVDYEPTTGTAILQPGATSFTIPVKICADTGAESDETLRITLSNPDNAFLDTEQTFGTIIDDDVLELFLDESGPALNQAVALDAIFHLRDPFRVVSLPEWIAAGPDRNTRVVLFARGLQLNPGETAADVSVLLRASNDQFYFISAEDMRAVANTDLTQVVFRLPDNLAVGICSVRVSLRGVDSNTGTIRIVQ